MDQRINIQQVALKSAQFLICCRNSWNILIGFFPSALRYEVGGHRVALRVAEELK